MGRAFQLVSWVSAAVLLVGVPITPARADDPEIVMPLTLTLTSSAEQVTADGSVSLVAEVDSPIEDAQAPLEIRDLTLGGALLASCSTGTSCDGSVSFYSGPAHVYKASLRGLSSAPVRVSVAPWSVSLQMEGDELAGGDWAIVRATTNQHVSAGGPYRIYIRDVTTGVVAATCGTGSPQRACMVSGQVPSGGLSE